MGQGLTCNNSPSGATASSQYKSARSSGQATMHQAQAQERVPDAVTIRVFPSQRWQVPGVLAPVLWDTDARESSQFSSECWRTWCKVNF